MISSLSLKVTPWPVPPDLNSQRPPPPLKLVVLILVSYLVLVKGNAIQSSRDVISMMTVLMEQMRKDVLNCTHSQIVKVRLVWITVAGKRFLRMILTLWLLMAMIQHLLHIQYLWTEESFSGSRRQGMM